MPKPYPKEFRVDVVRVAENREPGVTVEQIAADFGVHPMTLTKWLARSRAASKATETGSSLPGNLESGLGDRFRSSAGRISCLSIVCALGNVREQRQGRLCLRSVGPLRRHHRGRASRLPL